MITPGTSRRATDLRKTYRLTDDEYAEFRALPPREGAAIQFWQKVAATRGLDYGSIISVNHDTFTALPENHGKPWCWPLPIKCNGRPLQAIV